MRSVLPDLPPLSVLQTALRETTERLAREIVRSGSSAPEWSAFEWSIARAVAAMHGVSPLLAGALRWQGPPQWLEFLHDQRLQTATRHARIEELLRRIDLVARSAGIALVALKGAELHRIGVYRAGERPMGDVDLLVHSTDGAATTQLLESLGFRASFASWKHRLFVPQNPHPPRAGLGEHADNDLKVELHEQIQEALPVRREDVTAYVMPRKPYPGLNGYPSSTALMIHLLLHAAGAMVLRNVRLLQLHDLALLAARMSDADWNELLEVGSDSGGLWWAWPPLALAAHYYPQIVPTWALSVMEARCPRLLRSIARRHRLHDVSLSSLPIEAFPGIEWSQSLPEALGYVIQRVLPSRHALAARAELARTRGAMHASQWDRLSQWRRIVRWLTAPQARVESLYPVRVALLDGNGSPPAVPHEAG